MTSQGFPLEGIPSQLRSAVSNMMAGRYCLCRLSFLPRSSQTIIFHRFNIHLAFLQNHHSIHIETDQRHYTNDESPGKESPSAEPEAGGQASNYPEHIPTTCFQRSLLTVGSAALSLATPWRDDMIAVMGEVTGDQAIRYMQRKMKNHPVGSQILDEKPRINTSTVDLAYLRTLPEDTFGKKYVDFIKTERIDPDGRRPVQFVDEPGLAYVMQRYREVHDLIHILLGMPTHMLGEVVVKWVEGIQLGLPLGLLGGMFGALRLRPKQRSLYLQEHLWWALRVGRNAEFPLNIYFEKHWEQNIHEMREQFNIEEPPDSTPEKRWSKS